MSLILIVGVVVGGIVIFLILYRLFIQDTKLHQILFGHRIKLVLRCEEGDFRTITICCSSLKGCIKRKMRGKHNIYFEDVYISNDYETKFYVLNENGGEYIGEGTIDPESDSVCEIELKMGKK